MAEINWIKLSTSLPDNRKIKRIRKLPDGNNVILFWVFLLTRAGESNKSGGVFLTDTLPYSEEDLSADFDFSIEFVHFAILTLEKYSMITRYDDILFIKNWEDYQAIEGMEKIREQNRVRKKKQREREQQVLLGNNESRDCHVTSQQSHATDTELETDIENTSPVEKEQIPYKKIIDYLNEQASKKFKVTEKWKTLIKARWNEGQTYDDFIKVIDTKTKQWLNDRNMNKYLRPATLFGNKFDDYLNEYQEPVKSTSNDDVFAEQYRKMAEIYGEQ